jgi:hypothetical protein
MNLILSEMLNLIFVILIIIGGFVINYFKTNSKFKDKIAALINFAESKFNDGEQKKEYVINTIYSIIPAVFKPILNKTIINMIVQSVFDSMAEYAKKKLDKTTNKVENEIDKITGDSDKSNVASPVVPASK